MVKHRAKNKDLDENPTFFKIMHPDLPTQRLSFSSQKMVKHRAKKKDLDENPTFFKIMHPSLPTQRLRIPPGFVKYIPKEHSGRAILKGPSGKYWSAELRKAKNRTYLEYGWEDFRRNHSLWDYEFVVFRYDGNMRFNVQIFDKSWCERDDVIGSVRKRKRQGTTPKKCTAYTGKKRGRKPKKKRGRPRTQKRSRPFQNFGTSSELSESEACKREQNEWKVSQKEPGIDFNEERTAIENGCDPIQEVCIQIRGSSTARKSNSEYDRAKGWKAVESFTSSLPYFMRCLNKSAVTISYCLRVPTEFGKAHLPNQKNEIVLRNVRGETWTVNLVATQGYALCGGWSAFSHANTLKEGDICVFELVAELELCVHIFRQ